MIELPKKEEFREREDLSDLLARFSSLSTKESISSDPDPTHTAASNTSAPSPSRRKRTRKPPDRYFLSGGRQLLDFFENEEKLFHSNLFWQFEKIPVKKKIQIKKSSIGYGRGVFAVMDFPANAVLESYEGLSLIEKEEIEEGKKGGSLMKTPCGEYIDGSIGGNWTHYIQDFRKIIFNDKGHVIGIYEKKFRNRMNIKFLPMKLILPRVVTTRPIQAGEELFVDYGNDYWKDSKDHVSFLLDED